MNRLPFPVDANGVHYYDNADANGYLAMPVEQKILDSGGNFVSVSKTNPQPTSDVVTQTTLDSIDAVLNTLNVLITAIKSTDGIKKITDALPPGTNLLGKTIPVDTDGNEIFTESNPGVMQLSGSNVEQAPGSAIPAKGVLIGGSDGTNLVPLKVGADGSIYIENIATKRVMHSFWTAQGYDTGAVGGANADGSDIYVIRGNTPGTFVDTLATVEKCLKYFNTNHESFVDNTPIIISFPVNASNYNTFAVSVRAGIITATVSVYASAYQRRISETSVDVVTSKIAYHSIVENLALASGSLLQIGPGGIDFTLGSQMPIGWVRVVITPTNAPIANGYFDVTIERAVI